jgi:exopolysaccharide biosynthesis polyprenyl glycosylphosphotransferase
MSLPRAPRLRPPLALLDALALLLAVWLAHLVRFGPADRAAKWEQLRDHPGLIVATLLAMWAAAAAAELYEPLQLRRRTETALRVLVVTVLWAVGLVVVTYAVPRWEFGRGLLALTAVAWAVTAVVVRLAMARWLQKRLRGRALVVGEREAVAALCARLSDHPLSPWQPEDSSALASAQVADEARTRGVELVIVVGPEAGGTPAADLAALHFSGVPVAVVSEVWAFLEGRLPIGELSASYFLHQPGFGTIHAERFNLLTRVLDVAFAATLLLVTAPFVLLGGLAVVLAHGRPVFYLQTRAGRHGRPFRLVKLRTMHRDAERDGPAFATPGDPRVTAVGRVLRRLRLDELPQLVNVLRGEMSLVGPRPERPEFVAELAREIPYYTFRLAVPPGLTGWAQIHVPSAVTVDEHRRKLEYDLYFIRERSVGLYLFTLLRTASAALVGAGR